MVKLEERWGRRKLTEEFKAGGVRIVLDDGRSAGAVARDLDLTGSALRTCVTQARADRTKGNSGGLTTAQREVLARLRKENCQLRLERDVLEHAAAFLAKENE